MQDIKDFYRWLRATDNMVSYVQLLLALIGTALLSMGYLIAEVLVPLAYAIMGLLAINWFNLFMVKRLRKTIGDCAHCGH